MSGAIKLKLSRSLWLLVVCRFLYSRFFLYFIRGMFKTFSLETLGHFARISIIFFGMCSNEGQMWNSCASWVVSLALSARGAPLMEHHFKEQRITCAPSAKALLVCILCFRIIYLFIHFCSRGRSPAIHLPSCGAAEAPQGAAHLLFFCVCTNYLLGTRRENEERCQCNLWCNVASKRKVIHHIETVNQEGKERRCVHYSRRLVGSLPTEWTTNC